MGIPTDCANPLLLLNGDFAAATGWIVGANWTIAGGDASCVENGVPTDGYLDQILSGQDGHIYLVRFDVTAISVTAPNEFDCDLFGEFCPGITAIGSYEFFLYCPDTSAPANKISFYLQLTSKIGDSVTIDNVEVIDITLRLACEMGLSPTEAGLMDWWDIGDGKIMVRMVDKVLGYIYYVIVELAAIA